MQDILSFIIKNITTLPDEVEIKSEEEDGVTNYTIGVNPADVGRIIGKEGKVIKAIRTIMRTIAIQKGIRVRISVLSDETPTVIATETPEEVVTVEEPDSITVEM